MCEHCGFKHYDLDELENFETASHMFFHYIATMDAPIKFGQYVFIQCEKDIADGIVMKYQTLFGSDSSTNQLEFGILYKGDKPVAISRRIAQNGTIDPDSVGLYRLYPDPLELDKVYDTLTVMDLQMPKELKARMH